MKKVLLTLFYFLLIFAPLLGQTEPLLQKYTRSTDEGLGNDFWVTAERENTYDANGNLIFQELKGYSSPDELLYWRGGIYEYNNENLLTKYTSRRYNPDVDLWINDFWIDYKYDSNNCRMEEKSTNNIGGLVTRKVTFLRDEECRVISRYIEWLGTSTTELTPKDLSIREYLEDERSFDEYLYRYSNIGDSLYLILFTKNIHDDNDNLLERYSTVFAEDQDTISKTKIIYEYDEYENYTLISTFRSENFSNAWSLHRNSFYFYEYDENGFIIKKKTEQWTYDDPNSPQENLFYRQNFVYQNSCEGVPEEYIRNYEEDARNVKNQFTYLGLNDCLDLEKMNLDIDILPNPSYGEINVNSVILKSGDTNITVYAMDGKNLFEKKESSRSESTFLNLSFLHNGIYLLQLRNKDYLVNKKFIISK